MTNTQGLPPFRAIMAVDTVKFSRNPSAYLPQLGAAIPQLLGSAFELCGLADIWEARRFPQGTGDGYVYGVPHEHAPYLVDPILDQLQAILEEHDKVLRSQHRDLRLRLRVAIHLGSVPDSGGEQDRMGTPTNDTFRLLDSKQIKQEMDRSNPDVTFLAAILSQRVFEDVVRAGYTTDLHPDRFEHVIAEVEEKGFAQPAWMYVPKRSRRDASAQQSPAHEPATAEAGIRLDGTTIHGNVGNSISGGSFSGNVEQSGRCTP
jgi:hypothetical protein